MVTHKVVPNNEWLTARKELLVKERSSRAYATSCRSS
jgi:hypothetical protein